MKYLLVTLPLLILVGCQSSSNNDGYDSGYNLTCGFSSTKGNKLVVQSRFANNFLEGAIACAHDHPERARQVLGLAKAERPDPGPQAGSQTVPGVAAQSEQQEPAAAPIQIANVETPLKGGKTRSETKGHAKGHPTARANPKTKARTTREIHRAAEARHRTRALAKTKPHATAKSHPTAKAHAARTAQAIAKTAPKAKPKAAAAAMPGGRTRTHAARSTDYRPPVKTAPTQQHRHKGVDSYLGFMGE